MNPRQNRTPRKNIHFIKHFSELFKNNHKKRIFIIYGGAGSGKSFSVAQHICRLLCEGPGYSILVVRKTLPSLRITAYQLILDILNDWGIPYLHNKTLRTVTVGPNQIYFTGIDDPEKVKSSEFNLIWIEEASEVDKKTFLQLNLRLRKRNPARRNNQMFLTFNPINSFHWLITDVVEAPPNDKIIIHHSTYLDNPFLDSEYVEQLKQLEKQDPNFYRIYTLGLPGVLENVIYKNYVIEAAPKEAGYLPRTADGLGLDFGFNNETALIAVKEYEGRLYLKELLHVKGYTNTDLINWMKKHLPNRDIPIYADSAEPARIEEIAREGFNIWPARKEVVPGIDFLKAQKLVLDPDSPNLIEEFRNYAWRQDKDGRVLDEPVKFRDHTPDAARYCIYSMGLGEVPITVETLGKGKTIPGMRSQFKETGAVNLDEEEDLPEDWGEVSEIPGLDY